MSLVDFTTVPVYSVEFRCSYVIAEVESPFTYGGQNYDWGGARWEGELVFEYKDYDELSDLKAFISRCKGVLNSFNHGDSDYLIRGPRGAATSALVNGASQTGMTLDVDGLTVSTAGIIKEGDYIQLGTGADARLYQVTSDADSNGSGEATLNLNRTLLSSPDDNAAVVIDGAVGAFRLATNNAGWSANPRGFGRVTIPIKEAL